MLAPTYNLELSMRASRARHYRAGLVTERFFDRGHSPSYSILRYSAWVLGSLVRYAPLALLYPSCPGCWTCDNFFSLFVLLSIALSIAVLTSNPFLAFSHLALFAPN